MGNFKKYRNRGGFRPMWAGLAFMTAFFISTFVLPAPAISQTLTLDQWIDLGWDYYNAGNIDEAFNTFLQTVDEYPDSAIAHLSLGEIYIEMGQVGRGQNELLTSMALDDEHILASRAHYLFAVTLREDDPWEAMQHLERAHILGGTTALQFEIAHQMRFCRLMIRLPERMESGDIIIHYPLYTLLDDEAENILQSAEADQFLAERFCHHEITEPVHIFIYPTDLALWNTIAPDSGDEIDPVHRDYHMAYSDHLDFLPVMTSQVIFDMQKYMNRHAGASWIVRNLPYAIRGYIPWERYREIDSLNQSSLTSTIEVSVDDAVRSLVDGVAIVDLVYLTSANAADLVTGPVEWAELGSFIRWLRDTYSVTQFQEILTQPNFSAIVGNDIIELQNIWLEELIATPSLIADPELASAWAEDIPISPLAGDPNLPLRTLKEGLSLYLAGDQIHGIWQIRHSLNLDPGMALGYYTLGWIAVTRGDLAEAENQLGTAVKLFETPAEIAWCNSLLAPIYLHDQRWELASASLEYIIYWSESGEAGNWATEPYNRVNRILALRPDPIDRSSDEFNAMRSFFSDWNLAANGEGSLYDMTSELMVLTESESLVGFYSSLKERFPSIIINHAVQAVGVTGSSMYVEVRVQAAFGNQNIEIPSSLQALKQGGYLMFFQVIPTDDGWEIYDWEDGNFPIKPITWLSPEGFDIDTSTEPAEVQD